MLDTVHKFYVEITELDEQMDELYTDYLHDKLDEHEYDARYNRLFRRQSHQAKNLSTAFAELERLIMEDGDVPTEWSDAFG